MSRICFCLLFFSGTVWGTEKVEKIFDIVEKHEHILCVRSGDILDNPVLLEKGDNGALGYRTLYREGGGCLPAVCTPPSYGWSGLSREPEVDDERFTYEHGLNIPKRVFDFFLGPKAEILGLFFQI